MPGHPVAGQFADEPMSVLARDAQSGSDEHQPPPSSLSWRDLQKRRINLVSY